MTQPMLEDDCYMDDLGNEGIKLVGVASSHRSSSSSGEYPEHPPIETIKMTKSPTILNKNFNKGLQKVRSRDRYMESNEDDQVHMDTEEDQ